MQTRDDSRLIPPPPRLDQLPYLKPVSPQVGGYMTVIRNTTLICDTAVQTNCTKVGGAWVRTEGQAEPEGRGLGDAMRQSVPVITGHTAGNKYGV